MYTNKIMNQIEFAYHLFWNKQLGNPNHNKIEYIGINFHDNETKEPVFKCYYTTIESFCEDQPILRGFIERNMIHALNRITDTLYKGKIRYEIGLSNRNNHNMEWLYKWIIESSRLKDCYIRELRSMSGLSCCDRSDYQYSALYFLGFITDEKCLFPLETVKLHYLLRKCQNPEKIGENYIIDQEHIFVFLLSRDISAFQKLVSIVKPLLQNSGVELWMAAIDFFAENPAKYKLYLKIKQNGFCNSLICALKYCGFNRLIQQIKAYDKWLSIHPELKLYGIALCVTEQEEWSINFYH